MTVIARIHRARWWDHGTAPARPRWYYDVDVGPRFRVETLKEARRLARKFGRGAPVIETWR